MRHPWDYILAPRECQSRQQMSKNPATDPPRKDELTRKPDGKKIAIPSNVSRPISYFKGGVKMRNIILLVCAVIALFVSGCGQTAQSGNVSDKSYSMKVDNPQVRAFNQMLGGISDEASAEQTINSFVGYVTSKLNNQIPNNPLVPIQSVTALVSPEVVKSMAQQEALKRNIAVTIDASVRKQPPIDIGMITDNINQLGEKEGIKVNDEIVTKAKLAVEESMPNINPDNSAGMTPLEASVISYAILSGDDGMASMESVKIPSNKINNFVTRITRWR